MYPLFLRVNGKQLVMVIIKHRKMESIIFPPSSTINGWEKLENFFTSKKVGLFIASVEEQDLSIFENIIFSSGHDTLSPTYLL